MSGPLHAQTLEVRPRQGVDAQLQQLPRAADVAQPRSNFRLPDLFGVSARENQPDTWARVVFFRAESGLTGGINFSESESMVNWRGKYGSYT